RRPARPPGNRIGHRAEPAAPDAGGRREERAGAEALLPQRPVARGDEAGNDAGPARASSFPRPQLTGLITPPPPPYPPPPLHPLPISQSVQRPSLHCIRARFVLDDPRRIDQPGVGCDDVQPIGVISAGLQVETLRLLRRWLFDGLAILGETGEQRVGHLAG